MSVKWLLQFVDHKDIGEDHDPSLVPVKLPLGPIVKREVKPDVKANVKGIVRVFWRGWGGESRPRIWAV